MKNNLDDKFVEALMKIVLHDKVKAAEYDQLIGIAQAEEEMYGEIINAAFYEKELYKIVFGDDYETVQ